MNDSIHRSNSLFVIQRNKPFISDSDWRIVLGKERFLRKPVALGVLANINRNCRYYFQG
jgi:hypothetical protein